MGKSFAEVHPELIDEWSDKNLPIMPSDVTYGSSKKYWWICKHGHEWQASPKTRHAGEGCPYCSHNLIMPGFNDLATVHPEIAEEWSPKNLPWTPDQAPAGANRMAWWRCSEGHEWQTLIATRVKGSKCPYCSGYTLLKGFNDLKTRFPKLAEEWSDKNLPLLPEDINEKSRLNVWWKCSVCGYEWKSVVYTRVRGSQCPVCAGRNVLKGVNDLFYTDPELEREWDFDKNKSLPERYSRTSAERAWWKCQYGHSWSMKISDRTLHKKGCRVCETEFIEMLPKLAALYYAGKYGLKAVLDDESAIGMHLDTYIPSAGIAIEADGPRSSKTGMQEFSIKRLLCEKRRIKLYTITDVTMPDDRQYIFKGASQTDILKAVLTAFRRSNIYIKSDPEVDLEQIRESYFRWRTLQAETEK